MKKDLTGQKFNHLTVLRLDSEKTTSNRTYWICQCDCENKTIKSIRSDGLTSGKTKSCGCLNRQKAAERMKKIGSNNTIKEDLTGQRFGCWYVESRAQNQNNHTAWNCICDCGTKRIVLGQSLKSGVSQSCGCLNMSHGQKKILDLLSNAKIPFKREYTISDLYFTTKNNKARFDFYVKDSYAIEYDGQQHFKSMDQNYFRHNIEKIQQYDRLKNEYCKENNIPLIRIPYTHYNQLCLEDLLLETTKWRVV